MMAGLAAEHGEKKTLMIDATYLKAHRTASSLGAKKGARPPDWSHQGRHEHQASCGPRQQRPAAQLLRLYRTGERLHRGTSLAQQPARCRLAARGPGLRRRLVSGSTSRERDTRLYTRPKAAQGDCQIRQAALQTAQSDRDHVPAGSRTGDVWQRDMTDVTDLLLCHRSRCTRYLLAMSPEPRNPWVKR